MSQLILFSEALEALRNFFKQESFSELLTPPLVQNPGIEPHIHPFCVTSLTSKKSFNGYLHTSPEFWMKWVLAHEVRFKNIYTLSYCFRDEPKSQWHRNQFLMLEWYRKEVCLPKIMDDCEALLTYFATHFKLEKFNSNRLSMDQVFRRYLKNVSVFDLLDITNIRSYIAKTHSHLNVQAQELESWEDLFFLLFLNEIEPKLIEFQSVFIYDYPAPLAALSKINSEDPRLCERFEWYLNGIEVANCFHELTDPQEQLKRSQSDLQTKKKLYNYELPEPQVLIQALEKGLPPSCGIALGFERFLKIIFKEYDFQF